MLPSSPLNVPLGLPSYEIAQGLFQGFLAEFRLLESQLKTKQVQLAKQRRMDDNHCIYRDIAKPKAVPVHTLVTHHSTAVIAMSDDAKTAYVQPGILCPHQPVFGPHGMLCVSEHTRVVRDHDGFCFHIAKCPPQLLKQRVSEAWHSMVLSEVSCRDGFEGLETCNVQLTTERLHHYSHEQMGLLRVALNRTFFTRDKLIHSGHFTSTACPWCSEPRGSIFHRHWECPHFQNSRSMVDSAVFHQLPELSDCALQHGWVGLSPVLNEFCQCLDLAPDLTQDFHVDASSMTTLYLFTDGSCLNPRCPFSRIASWGVVCADLENDVFQEVSQGPLQGLHQTIFRAECVAVISAVKFGLHARKPFWIS